MKAPYKTHTQQLDAYISLLEAQKQQDFLNLKSQFYETSDYYKPINLLKRAIIDIKETSEVKTNLFETLISITGGYFFKKIILGKSNTLVKKVIGYVLQYAVINFISKKVSSDTNN